MQSFKLAQPHSLAHFHSMNVEYRQCKFIRVYFLLYQGKMMCESEVNQCKIFLVELISVLFELNSICFQARTSGSFIDFHRSHNCVRHTKGWTIRYPGRGVEKFPLQDFSF